MSNLTLARPVAWLVDGGGQDDLDGWNIILQVCGAKGGKTVDPA
jgi:hypothetical protein